MGVGIGLRISAHAVPWTPNRLLGNGLTTWLRADLGLTLVGSAVSSWADQSGSGRNWTDGSVAGRRPAYSATSFNGKPGITFDGATDYLVPSLAFTFGAASTIILVGTPATSATAYIMAGSGGNFGMISNFAGWLEFFNGADRKDFAVPTAATKFTATVVQTDGSNLQWRRNGTQVGSVAPTVALAGRGWDGLGALGAGSNFCNSTIAEIIVCNRALTATEIGQAETYIRSRYGHY